MSRSRPGRRIGLLAAAVGGLAVVVLAALWVAWRVPAQDASVGASPTAEAPGTGLPDGSSTEPVVPPVDEVAVDAPVAQTGGAVTVVLTAATWEESTDALEAGGFVSGVVEAGGACRLTLTRRDVTVVVESPGEPDASTTVCGGLAVSRDELSEGTWRAVLSYESATSSGVSAPVEVEVPSR